MILVYKFFKESFLFALSALHSNKLRTLLTLSGVTIGIFSIISVLTLIDYLEERVQESIQSLGDNVIYIQKWPWTPPEGESEYPWWRYLNRPVPNLDEFETVQRRSQIAAAAAFMMAAERPVIFTDNSYDNVAVMGVSHDFERIWSFSISKGRYFSWFESHKGANVALLGADVAGELFQGADPVGKRIKLMGRKLEVIGVFEREGEDMFGNSLDKNMVIPVNYARSLFNLRSEAVQPLVMVKAKSGFSVDDLLDELTGIMRTARRLKPLEDNNFALNRISLVQRNFDSLFSAIDFAGWFIGGFSILVGGFGIANIMFVSVRERTRIIGIQKALGAKRRFVLWQFLIESTFLSLLGGIAGLGLIMLIALGVNQAMDLAIQLSLVNILKGIGISVVIGILSGYIPAWFASRLDPVNAINAV